MIGIFQTLKKLRRLLGEDSRFRIEVSFAILAYDGVEEFLLIFLQLAIRFVESPLVFVELTTADVELTERELRIGVKATNTIKFREFLLGNFYILCWFHTLVYMEQELQTMDIKSSFQCFNPCSQLIVVRL